MIKNNIFFPNTKVSLSNKFWVKPSKIIQQKATNFQKIFSLPYPILILLAQKGLKINDIENFLNPMVKFNMPDPYSLFDVKKGSRNYI